MKAISWLTVLATALAVLPVTMAAAPPPGDAEPEMIVVKVKVPVKRYKALAPDYVYKAAAYDIQADVRFSASFAGKTVVPDAVRRIRLNDRRYTIVLAFRTQEKLVCLVPGSARRTLEALFDLPEDWPMTPAILNRPIVAREGQKVAIEGTIVGARVGEKFVLADAVYLGQAQRPTVKREVQVFWAGLDEPKDAAGPGTYLLDFPCHHVADQKAVVKVTIRALARGALRDEQALRVARLEVPPGKPAEKRQYGQFSPEAVFRHTDDDERIHVEFADVVDRAVEDLPEAIESVRVVRYGRVGRIRIGAAFQTGMRLTCLVPAELPTPVAQVADMLPGEKVRVRGTVLGRLGADRCVLVDYLSFPDQESSDPFGDVWLVTVEWPSRQPRTLQIWDYGRYPMPNLPCLFSTGRQEAIQIVLRQYHEIEVKRPAPEEELEG